MTWVINKTFPDKLGEVIDCKGLPFDVNAAAYDNRLKKIFTRIFTLFENQIDTYWDTLKKMISNPNDTFGLVCIDGFLRDMSGSDDIALIFNMGIPRLRGRTIYNLDRIYLRLPINGDIRFYNSYLDGEEQYYDMTHKGAIAWHPHIQNTYPCLGGYGNELTRWRSEGNPIMYLNVIYQFLNTWNRNSPFWDLNHKQIDHLTPGGKTFKQSVIDCALHSKELSTNRFNTKFILNNIDKISTKSLKNDAHLIAIILRRLISQQRLIVNKVEDLLNESDQNYYYLKNIVEESDDYDDSSYSETRWRNFSIINDNSNNTQIMIPVFRQKRTTRNIHRLNTSKITNNENYRLSKRVLLGLEKLMIFLYRYVNDGDIYKIIYENSDYPIRLYAQYVFPLLSKQNKFYDKMTNTNLYKHRVGHYTNEDESINNELSSEKSKVFNSYQNRLIRVNRMITKYYQNMFTSEFVNDHIDNVVNEAFKYETVEYVNHEGLKVKRIEDKGQFWKLLSVWDIDDLGEIESIFNKKFPSSLIELIKLYENIKIDMINKESDFLIEEYSTVIRSLKQYGNETNNTKEDSQQVHLSFE